MSGTLYIVATPIGNLEDITLRALRILKEVDLIACEDTRHTRKLLTHYEITKPLVSYFEHNKITRGEHLIRQLKEGKSIALVSDAGTPGISDPGYNLIHSVLEEGIEVVPIPGPSAAIAALSASGLPTDQFHFVGFLPLKEGKKRRLLESLKGEGATLVVYESPFRVRKTLQIALELFGNIPSVAAHELTKIHEGFFRGPLADLLPKIGRDVPEKGEWILLFGLQR
ncbi:MAG: 16S rRNA (cytidine(1402)-2'-O)-methyltransferase [Deltaproteobacteria bacterium]|nr:16S rRNA (cytidine(1402)-2'-O)-methyltransferase [Deltaproteobacteria bacterium]